MYCRSESYGPALRPAQELHFLYVSSQKNIADNIQVCQPFVGFGQRQYGGKEVFR